MTPQRMAEIFEKSQYLLLLMIAVAAYFGFRSRSTQSQFKSREADRPDLDRIRKPSRLADAKIAGAGPAHKNPPPLSLPGIRLEGEPHEILGIKINSSEAEIMRAYKEAIKMYHPDRIQGPAQEQIKFYEEASAKINLAKEMMIAKVRKNS